MPVAASAEWSRYYHLEDVGAIGALHARFVTHRFPRHTHEHLVVGLVEHGVQQYQYRRARHRTAAGEMFLVNPEEPHTGEPADEAGYVYRTLYVPVPLLERVARELSKPLPAFAAATLGDPTLRRRLVRLHAALAEGAPRAERETRLWDALVRLVGAHARGGQPPRTAGAEPAAVRRAREILEADFAADVALADLARAVALSPYYLARAFERAVGMPPHAYLESVRMRRACALLDGGGALADVALAVGYADQSHFTRRFRRLLGVPPGAYAGRGKIRQDRRRPA